MSKRFTVTLRRDKNTHRQKLTLAHYFEYDYASHIAHILVSLVQVWSAMIVWN